MKITIDIEPWMRSIFDRERMRPLLRVGHLMTLEQWAENVLQSHCAIIRDCKVQDRMEAIRKLKEGEDERSSADSRISAATEDV